jgi:cytochrome P450
MHGESAMLENEGQVLDWPFTRTNSGCPPSILAQLREAPPCAVRIPAGAAEARRAWLVTKYSHVRQALKDRRLSADESLSGAPVRIQVPPGQKPGSFLRMDDPEHARLRHTVTTEFTARRIRELRPAIEQLIDELLNDLAAGPQPVDLQNAFSRKLPTLVIGRLLGIPDEDSAFFVEKTRVTISQGDPARAYAAYQEISEYLEVLALRKQKNPQGDALSRLAAKHLATGNITLDELVGIARLILVAGHETTTNQIALNILSMLMDDELRNTVLENDGALLPQYVEESMRYWSISQDAIVRLAIEDLTLGGIAIKEGDAVVISIPAANHDESMFPNPGHIDVHRDTSGHLQWGIGPHYCQGAPLARLEMVLALKKLFTCFPGLRLAVDDSETLFRKGTVFHGLDHLPVTW